MNPIVAGNTISTVATVESVSPAGALKTSSFPLSWHISDDADGESSEYNTGTTFIKNKYYLWSLDVTWDSILNVGFDFDEMSTVINFNDIFRKHCRHLYVKHR